MKRFVSVILLILVLVNIFSITAFASSGEDSSDSGYSMTLNGVEHRLDYQLTSTVTQPAPDGMCYYNGVLLPDVNTIDGMSGYKNKYIFKDSSYYYLLGTNTDYSYMKAYYENGYWNLRCPITSFSVPSYKTSVSNPTSWAVARSSCYISSTSTTFRGTEIVYTSDWLANGSGGWASRTGTVATSTSVTTTTDHTVSFPSSDLSGLSAVDRELILSGSVVEGEFSGDLKYGLSVSNPYIDVELPVSAWVDEVPEDNDYWSVSINGDLSFDLGIGLQGISGGDQSHYILSDLVPSSWQLICNGSLLSDSRCSGGFDSVGLTESGYHVNFSMDTGQFSLASVSTGEYGVKPRTLGFRIYLKSLGGGTTTISDYELDSVTPYAYLNFTSADGSSGLPALTFHENYASGDMSGVVDSSGYGSSAADLGFTFGYYSNAVAASGKCFYGEFELPVIPVVSGKPYYTLVTMGDVTDSSMFYLFVSSALPVFDLETSKFDLGSGYGLYTLSAGATSWVDRSSMASSFGVNSLNYVHYINYALKDSSGALRKSAMSPSSSGSGPAYSAVSPGSDFLNFNSNAGHAVLFSSPVSYDSVGSVGSKFSFSNDSMTGYVDVTYPAQVFGIRSNGQLLSLLLSGNLAVRSSIFPLAIDSSTNEYYVPYSFDNPTMVEVIINGEFFSDLYLLNYLHEDSTIASVSGFNMSLDEIGKVKTVTFRFHYSVNSQATEWLTPEDIPVSFDSFAVGVDCEIITSPVFTAEYEPDRVMTGLGKFFDNLAIPYEISQVFDVFVGIWEVIPAAVRFTLIMCFSVACFFAVAKMLF